MERKTTPENKAKKPQSREDRLKAALKANMGRRKAQAKARAATDTADGAEAVESKRQD